MASACINNIGFSPEKFLDSPAKYSSYGWFSPRMSFGREEEASKSSVVKPRPASPPKTVDDNEIEADQDSAGNDIGDFEFRLEYPVTMLPADELFSDGKLMPLHLSSCRPPATASEFRSPDEQKVHPQSEISRLDPYLFSPKAPRCSSRWKELLGLKKLYQNSNAKQDNQKTSSLLPNQNNNTSTNAAKSLKHLLHRSSKSSPASVIDSYLSHPLLKDTENESISISSRLSLSSSSSGHSHDDLPRLSLDLEKPISNNLTQKYPVLNQNPPRIRLVKHRTVTSESRVTKSPMRRQVDNNAGAGRGLSADSPRMNSSGKIVFHSLERSSSSPGSFNGGPRNKHRGVERSYSANVRVTPVLNVPVCSLRGSSKSGGVFGFPLFSAPPHKRSDSGGGNNGGANGGNGSRSSHHHQQSSSKNKTDRSS